MVRTFCESGNNYDLVVANNKGNSVMEYGKTCKLKKDRYYIMP